MKKLFRYSYLQPFLSYRVRVRILCMASPRSDGRPVSFLWKDFLVDDQIPLVKKMIPISRAVLEIINNRTDRFYGGPRNWWSGPTYFYEKTSFGCAFKDCLHGGPRILSSDPPIINSVRARGGKITLPKKLTPISYSFRKLS